MVLPVFVGKAWVCLRNCGSEARPVSAQVGRDTPSPFCVSWRPALPLSLWLLLGLFRLCGLTLFMPCLLWQRLQSPCSHLPWLICFRGLFRPCWPIGSLRPDAASR